jgi:hypothetical protein
MSHYTSKHSHRLLIPHPTLKTLPYGLYDPTAPPPPSPSLPPNTSSKYSPPIPYTTLLTYRSIPSSTLHAANLLAGKCCCRSIQMPPRFRETEWRLRGP